MEEFIWKLSNTFHWKKELQFKKSLITKNHSKPLQGSSGKPHRQYAERSEDTLSKKNLAIMVEDSTTASIVFPVLLKMSVMELFPALSNHVVTARNASNIVRPIAKKLA